MNKLTEKLIKPFLTENTKMYGLSIKELLNTVLNFKGKTIIYFDTETLGFQPKTDYLQLTEVAAMAYDGNTFKEIGKLDYKVNLTKAGKNLMKKGTPERKSWEWHVNPKDKLQTPEDVFKMTRYGDKTAEFVKEAHALNIFFEFFNKYKNPVLIAHNAPFDLKYLGIRASKYGIKMKTYESLDTLKLNKMFFLPFLKSVEKSEELDLVLNGLMKVSKTGRKSVSSTLGSLSKALKIDASEWHNALADVEMLMGVLFKMVKLFKKYEKVDISKLHRTEVEKVAKAKYKAKHKKKKKKKKKKESIGEAVSKKFKIIGVYPGRFQPFGKHHHKTYEYMVKMFGKNNTYISTSNKVESGRSPLNFKEKQQLISKMGIPKNKIILSKQPYLWNVSNPAKLDLDNTIIVYAFGKKDAGRIVGGKLKSGKPSYFQQYSKHKNNLKPASEHSYYIETPHISLKIMGKEINGTWMRELLGSSKFKGERKQIFKDLFGYFDKGVFNMMKDKFGAVDEHIDESLPTKVNDKYKKVKPGDPKDKKKFKQFIDHHKYHSGPHINGLESEPETYDFDDFDNSTPGVQKRKKDKKKKGYEPVTEGWLEKGSKKDKALKLKITKLYSKAFKHMPNSPTQLKIRKEIEKLRNQLSEGVDLPIEIGDTVLMGKFKNKKVVVKTIGWNEKGDLLINGKSAMRMRIPKKPNIFDENIIKEFLTTIDMGEIIKEATTTALSGLQAVDSGPNALMNGMGGYSGRNKKQAEKIGWEVIDYILDVDVSKIPPFTKEFKNDRINSVTFLPAGIGTGKTPNNQDNLTGVGGYNKWVKHMKKIAQNVGFQLMKFKDEAETKKRISKDTKDVIKTQRGEEKDKNKEANKPKVKESFSKDWWKKELLAEGGAYGHMAHPFDDKDLTFGDLKKIIEDGLGGTLNREDNVTEKLDGQNIMISWKDGNLIAARNKGQLKGWGKNALTVKQIISKFEGHAKKEVKDAYTFAITDLNKAIGSLSKKQQDKIFDNGKNFMNLEIMYAANPNTIDYDVSELIFHGALKYDESGNVIGEVKNSARMLEGMIRQVNQHIQKKFKISKPVFLNVPKHQDFGKMKSKFLGRLKKLKNEFGLSDSDTIGMYHQSYWTEYIYNAAQQFDYKMPIHVLKGLTKRWAFFDKSYNVRNMKKDIDNEQFLDWVLSTDKNDHSKLFKSNMRSFEVLFFDIGAEILKGISGFMVASPDKAVKKMRKDVESAIKTIKGGGDLKKLNRLKVQLDRLEAIGGLDSIVPSEGIVFKYNGNTYKFTGAYAPVNQITSLVTFY